MNEVSLFDGIACGRVALERAGLKVSSYHAFEIEQNAINCAAWNWPNIRHYGSVAGADFKQFKNVDLLIGGFPCTDLSIAKEGRKGLAGKSSGLFWEQVRAIQEIKPRFFLVENNYGMPKKDMDIITDTLGVEPIYINSALVSAQNRRRLYWTNIPGVTVPKDRGIVLKDVLQNDVPLKYYHSKNALNYLTRTDMNARFIQDSSNNKAACLTTNYRTVPYNALAGYIGETDNQDMRMYKTDGKHCTLMTGKSKNPHIVYPAALRTWPRYPTGDKREKLPEIGIRDKSNALLTSSNENMITHTGSDNIPVFEVQGGLMIYGQSKVKVRLTDGYYALRKLTPLECERLQTLPDGYTEMIPDTWRYHTLGNGWTADVIAHILSFIHLDGLI